MAVPRSVGPNYGTVRPIAILATCTLTPLGFTTAPHALVTLAAGVALAAALIWMTFRCPSSPVSFDEKIEARAIRDIVMTSSSNRGVRVLLGLVYFYAAAAFAFRWTTSADGGHSLRYRLAALEPAAVCIVAAVYVGTFLDAMIGGMWLSTGADGQ